MGAPSELAHFVLAGALFTLIRDSVPGTKVKDISVSVFNFDNILIGRVGIVLFPVYCN